MTIKPTVEKLNQILEWGYCFCDTDDNEYCDAIKSAIDNLTATDELLNEFVEFLIKETCRGCKMCMPGVDDKGVVCIHQGEAVWYRHMIERFYLSKSESEGK